MRLAYLSGRGGSQVRCMFSRLENYQRRFIMVQRGGLDLFQYWFIGSRSRLVFTIVE